MGRKRKKDNDDIKILIYIIERDVSESNNKVKIPVKRLKMIGSFLVSLVTVAASLATCFTLWEMRNERNQSYKPYFVIEPVMYTDEFRKPLFGIGDIRNLGNSLTADIEKRPQMNIIINNLRSGTATNIDIIFSDEVYEKYWEIACRYYDNDKIKISESINYYFPEYCRYNNCTGKALVRFIDPRRSKKPHCKIQVR